MSKYFKYSCVTHNIRADYKDSITSVLSRKYRVKKLSVAIEPYADQEGQHAHIFVEFLSQISKASLLKCLELYKVPYLLPLPDDETRAWGRVQVDQMRGTFDEANRYLTNPDKNKVTDPEPLLSVEPPGKHDRTCILCGTVFSLGTRYPHSTEDYPDCRSGLCWKHTMLKQITQEVAKERALSKK